MMDPSTLKIKIERGVLHEGDLEKLKIPKSEVATMKQIETKFKKIIINSKHSPLRALEYFLPIILWIRLYNWKKNLKGDIISGITVGVMQISQGLAYGELAGLEPITGLYVSLIPGLIYAVFGSSRYIHLGSFAVVSLMVSTVINHHIPIDYAKKYIATGVSTFDDVLQAKYIVATTLTLTVGLLQIMLYMLNGGIVAKLLSPTIVHAFTFAASLQVLSSQFAAMLGISVPASAMTSTYGLVVQKYIYIFKHISHSNVGSIIISLVSLCFLIGIAKVNSRYIKKIKIPIPGDLLIIIIVTSLSYGFKFNEKYKVPIVGHIPAGLPHVVKPDFRVFSDIIASAVIIAVVTFAIDVSIAKQLYSHNAAKKMSLTCNKSKSEKEEFKVRPNQELLALGLANTISSFFQCYVAGSSLARSMIHSNIGESQLFSFVAATVILIVLLFASSLFYYLPKAILSSIVIAALIPIFLSVAKIKVYWQLSKREFFIWLLTVLAVTLIGTEVGLGIGILISLSTYLYNIIKPKIILLAPIDNDDIYKDSKLYTTKTPLHNISIFSFKCPLFYLNNEKFLSSAQETINSLTSQIPEPANNDSQNSEQRQLEITMEPHTDISQNSSTRYHFIIDFSSIPFVDMSSYDIIKKVIFYAESRNTFVYACCTSSHIYRNLISRSITHIFPTIQDAVTFAQANVS